MARRKAGDEEAAKPSEVRKAISKNKLRALLASAKKTKADVDEIVGGHRSEIATAVENHYLHKKAFAITKSLNRLEPENLRETLDCLDHYLDISGLRERAESAPAMTFEEVDDIDAKTDRKNVRDFPAPRAEAAE